MRRILVPLAFMMVPIFAWPEAVQAAETEVCVTTGVMKRFEQILNVAEYPESLDHNDILNHPAIEKLVIQVGAHPQIAGTVTLTTGDGPDCKSAPVNSTCSDRFGFVNLVEWGEIFRSKDQRLNSLAVFCQAESYGVPSKNIRAEIWYATGPVKGTWSVQIPTCPITSKSEYVGPPWLAENPLPQGLIDNINSELCGETITPVYEETGLRSTKQTSDNSATLVGNDVFDAISAEMNKFAIGGETLAAGVSHVMATRNGGGVSIFEQFPPANFVIFHSVDGCWARFSRSETEYGSFFGIADVFCPSLQPDHVARDNYWLIGPFIRHVDPAIPCSSTALPPVVKQRFC